MWRSRLQYRLVSPGVDLLQTSTRDQKAGDRDSNCFEIKMHPEWFFLPFYIEFLISLVIKSECTSLESKLHCWNKHHFFECSTVNSFHHICIINSVWNQRWLLKPKYGYFLIFFSDYMFLVLPAYELYILHNHKIIFTAFSDGSLWSSGMKPHLKYSFIPCGLFVQSIYRKNSEIHRIMYFLIKRSNPYFLQLNNFFGWLSQQMFQRKAV